MCVRVCVRMCLRACVCRCVRIFSETTHAFCFIEIIGIVSMKSNVYEINGVYYQLFSRNVLTEKNIKDNNKTHQ